MTKQESYPQGAPTWVDLMTTDAEGAKSFYGDLFGWEFEDAPMDTGDVYTMAKLDGDEVAGLGEQGPDMQGMPPAWHVYLAVDDVDTVASRVPGAGGTLVMPPTDVMDQGRIAVATDPAGATVGFWQAGRQKGAKRTDEPGAMTWHELLAADFAKALPFYTEVLEVGVEDVPMPGGPDYHCLVAGGKQVAGAMASPMPGVPPHWHVYFNAADVDASCARAEELGGAVVAPPFEVEGVGRFAVLSDPQGGMFSLLAHASA